MMIHLTRYERLLDEIENDNGVELFETSYTSAPAHAVRIDDEHYIAFNERAFGTVAERHVALAHEKAHCDVGGFYIFNSPRLTYEVCEAKAWRRTVQDRIPFAEMKEVFRRYLYIDGLDICGLAEHFEVTPKFMTKAIEHYRHMDYAW